MVSTQVLDYAPPARPRWGLRLLRAAIYILIIIAGGALAAVIGDHLQGDLWSFNGYVAVSPPGAGTGSAGAELTTAKQAHIAAMRASIPAAAAALNAQGISISAAALSDHVTIKDVPQSRLIAVRCTSRSPQTTLDIVNALILPYCNKVPAVKALPGTLSRSLLFASSGFVLGCAVTGLIILLSKRRRVS